MRRVWLVEVTRPDGKLEDYRTVEPTYFETEVTYDGSLIIASFIRSVADKVEFVRSCTWAAGTWSRKRVETKEYSA